MLKFAGLFFLAAVPCLVLGQARSGTVPRPLAITHAVELGKIRVEAQGAGISSVLLDVTRLSAEPLRVVIPAGTFFVNSTSAQDMVAARETVVDLTRGKLVSVRVSALCANFGKAAPDARSSFGISALPDSEDLKKLIPVLKAGKSTQPVAQVAVWMVTDDVSEAALASRLRRRGNGRTINGASDAEMLRGIQLLARAGVGLEDKLLYKTLAERYAQTMGISNLANALTGAAGNDIVDVAGLSDPREEIRLNSAYSLKASRNPLVRPAMIAALRDPYDQVRCWAAEYIPNSGTPAAFDLLLALTRDKEEIVRVCAAKALAQLGDPRALKPLIELQEGDKDVGDYREAVAALRERLNGKSAPKR